MVIQAFIEDKIEVDVEMIKTNIRLYRVWLWDFIYNIVKLLHISLISLKHRIIFFNQKSLIEIMILSREFVSY